jgi:hypothetical protein
MTDDAPFDDRFTTEEVLTPEQVEQLRRMIAAAEAGDDEGVHRAAPPPTVPPPSPTVPLPAAAVPGQPPPPLPGAGTAARGPASPSQDEEDLVDPALGSQHGSPWVPRLLASPPEGWSVAAVLRASGPMRRTASPRPALVEEDLPLTVTALYLPEGSLDPHPEPVPLLSRLRMLHTRLLPPEVRSPLTASWSYLDRRPAVLDLLACTPDGAPAGFSLAAEAGHDVGLVVLGSVHPARSRALTEAAVPLAEELATEHGRLRWRLPAGWWGVEQLQLTTDTARVTVELEPRPPDRDLDDWTAEVFARGPYLRDMRVVADRPVRITGLEQARLQRFDWQPAGRGRHLTTVVTGVAEGIGVSVVTEGPLELARDASAVDLLELLDAIAVLPLGDTIGAAGDQGRPSRARTAAGALPALPTSPFAEARSRIAQCDAIEALTLLERAMTRELFPPLDVLTSEVVLDRYPGLHDAAVEVRRHPTDAGASVSLGVELAAAGLPRAAVNLFRAAVRVAPGDPEPLRWLAEALVLQGRAGEARSILLEHHGAVRGHADATCWLVRSCLLIGDEAGARAAASDLTRPSVDAASIPALHRQVRQAMARLDAHAGAADPASLDASDLRGWHHVHTGGVLTGLAPRHHVGMNGRFALLYDSDATCHAGLLRLAEVLRVWGRSPTTVRAFPDRDSRAFAIAAGRLLGCRVEDLGGGDEDGLLIAYDLGAVDPALLWALAPIRDGQVLFAHAVNWTHPPPVAPDVVTLLCQSLHRPWDATMRLLLEDDTAGPRVVEEPADTGTSEHLAGRILAADPAASVLDPDDDLEGLLRFVALTAKTAAGALGHGVRDRVWLEEVVGSSRFA